MGLETCRANILHHSCQITGTDYKDHSQPHIENLVHFPLGHLAVLLKKLKHRKDGPGFTPDSRLQSLGNDTWDVAPETAARDVNGSVKPACQLQQQR